MNLAFDPSALGLTRQLGELYVFLVLRIYIVDTNTRGLKRGTAVIPKSCHLQMPNLANLLAPPDHHTSQIYYCTTELDRFGFSRKNASPDFWRISALSASPNKPQFLRFALCLFLIHEQPLPSYNSGPSRDNPLPIACLSRIVACHYYTAEYTAVTYLPHSIFCSSVTLRPFPPSRRIVVRGVMHNR